MRDPVYKRCLCREDGRELGASCPRLKRKDGSWNPKHGSWYFSLELPKGAGGTRRRRLRRGGYDSREDAFAALDEARRQLEHGADPSVRITVGEYLESWIRRRVDLKPTTARNYGLVVSTYLLPLLGHLELARLQTGDVADMFGVIRGWNDQLAAGERVRKYQRHVGPAAMQRIRATLRVALADAVDEGLISFNPAVRVRMERETARKPVIWTAERASVFWAVYQQAVEAEPMGRGDRAFRVWSRMDLRPAPVMVWTPADMGRFLDHAGGHRLATLFELVAATGMRRGEACGLRWEDVDLDNGMLSIGRARVQVGWQVVDQDPKSEASKREVAIAGHAVTALRAWRKQQLADRLAWGSDYTETGLVFTREDGKPWHPDAVTEAFERLAFGAGLPPVKLHGLRHGWATYAVAQGVDIKLVQAGLGHSTSRLTRDTYTGVLSDQAREAAEKVAQIIPRRGRDHG